MNRFLGILLITILCACEPAPIKKNTPTNTITSNKAFVLSGSFNEYFTEYVYLNKIVHNTFVKLDSSKVENNNFHFSGVVAYPERFALSFENSSSKVVLILENTNFHIQLDAKNITASQISNSPLNDELNHYKNHAKEIFRGIDKLYPRFQKARLENDAATLEEIGAAVDQIETDYRNYSFNYVDTHTESYISPMILRDLIKADNADIQRIKESYSKLSEEVLRTPDSQIISTELELTQER